MKEDLKADIFSVWERLAKRWNRQTVFVRSGYREALRQIIKPRPSWFGESIE